MTYFPIAKSLWAVAQSSVNFFKRSEQLKTVLRANEIWLDLSLRDVLMGVGVGVGVGVGWGVGGNARGVGVGLGVGGHAKGPSIVCRSVMVQLSFNGKFILLTRECQWKNSTKLYNRYMFNLTWHAWVFNTWSHIKHSRNLILDFLLMPNECLLSIYLWLSFNPNSKKKMFATKFCTCAVVVYMNICGDLITRRNGITAKLNCY